MMSTEGYALDNAWIAARERLVALERSFDDGTHGILESLGVEPGWRCLEVGAGAGSIARWLAERVGATGHVLATDIDPRHVLPAMAEFPNLAVRQHDILSEPLPEAGFDLVHTRMVLEHLPGRYEALGRIAEAVAPGGWLVVEAIDFGAEAPDPALATNDADLFWRWHVARSQCLADRGFDLTFARGLDRRFRALGLEQVRAEGRAATCWGGSPWCEVERLTVAQLREPLLAGGYLEPDEIDRLPELFTNPAFAVTSPLIMAVIGRRPGTA